LAYVLTLQILKGDFGRQTLVIYIAEANNKYRLITAYNWIFIGEYPLRSCNLWWLR